MCVCVYNKIFTAIGLGTEGLLPQPPTKTTTHLSRLIICSRVTFCSAWTVQSNSLGTSTLMHPKSWRSAPIQMLVGERHDNGKRIVVIYWEIEDTQCELNYLLNDPTNDLARHGVSTRIRMLADPTILCSGLCKTKVTG